MRLRVYTELVKLRLNLLVVFSAFTGFYIGSSGQIDLLKMLFAMSGIGLAGMGVAALNQYMERHHDARMQRTRNRPLPVGKIQPVEAILSGIFLSMAGCLILLNQINWLTALLVLLTIVSYLFIYTPLKRISSLNTIAGAVPGALPIVCGWTAAGNPLNIEAAVLFGLLFFWQFPHFLAIAVLNRKDYKNAGYVMLPSIKNGFAITRGYILLNTLALILVSLAPTYLGLTGNAYLLVAAIAGIGFLAFAIATIGNRESQNPSARRLMFASFIYPLCIWGMMIFDKV